MFDTLVEKLKKDPKTIVFTEGPDARILEATARIKAEGIMKVVLLATWPRLRPLPRRAALISRA